MAGETLRERAARALAARDRARSGEVIPWDKWSDLAREMWLDDADAALAVVAEDVDGIAEAGCRATHPTRWEYQATSSPCDSCATAAIGIAAHIGARS